VRNLEEQALDFEDVSWREPPVVASQHAQVDAAIRFHASVQIDVGS
jgi:hypothetical protein